ncbi:hypothetical protein XENTR_v10014627 [Xenopus tropicalis]|uniref:Protein ANKUB1 n=1 Tax=Xenopus tropicalis TaxID=8364 RepID=A0A8J0QSB8_XENTR|nr:protein ANKUB1 [Xenopus tropicalis]KAE8604223.1 hypothetical protein XENTR_v10014627 [Xenopus tropicalis]|eukprot:XP_002937140.2 PREDICTED: protein ANKUB1 [Xenopus tropicalis]
MVIVGNCMQDYFHVQLSDDKQGRRILELTFAGGVLRDEWVLTDVGITLCSTIKCTIKEETKPALYVFNAVTKERIGIFGGAYLFTDRVSSLKTLISQKSGYPVSIYTLRTWQGTEMYNCNCLSDYKLDLGASLRMDVWDGWKELLKACVTGHKNNVQRYLAGKQEVLRYQERVALYIAAHFGHLELAQWLLNRGVRADEAVGVHPYREWCHETDHPDVGKCAIHAAAEAGQLLVLKAFIAHNVLCLQCQNPVGQTPLKICTLQGHKDCVLYLVMKTWSLVSFPNISLPMNIYIKVKKWLFVAQKHIWKVKKRLVEFKTRVGDTLVVDGFTEPNMTSRGLHRLHHENGGKETDDSGNKSLCVSEKHGTNKVSHDTMRNGKGQKLKLPPIHQTITNCTRSKDTSLGDTFKNTWTAHVPLPPLVNAANGRPQNLTDPHAVIILNSSLKSFSKHSGRTPRENAIYCLGLASEFKEKTWLRQLDVARMLAKKSVCSF